MPKRMTDTDKWKKPFLKTLPVEYKLFWLYLLDECDHAGIWHVELDLAEMRLGIKLSHQKIRGFFKERIVEFDNGTKWFLPDFVGFQYGELDVNNRAHKSVVDRLKKYDLLKNQKGVASPLQGGKDKDKAKDTDIIGGVGEESLCWNVEELIKGRQRDFESICMGGHRSAEQGFTSLSKYHLWLERESKYPKTIRSLLSGFKLWLANEKPDRAPPPDNKYEDQLTAARKNFKPTQQ